MRVLGIESSCDETALAIYDEEEGLLSHVIHSQTAIHACFGGVVPELASRDHIAKILPLLQNVLNTETEERNPKKDKRAIPLSSIQCIAYTAGPGLVGALMVGACFAKALGFSLNIPTIPIHHMEGHLLAALLEDPKPEFPFLALLVSGGHTQLVKVAGIGQYTILGESLDDAVGEAFDKTAKLLGLGYPGGPALAQLAKDGNKERFHFPRPLTEKPGLDFSFSGLKTFAMTTLKNNLKPGLSDTELQQLRADIAYAFQESVVETLYIKCKRALQKTGLNRLVIAGGVGANQRLRAKLKELETDPKMNTQTNTINTETKTNCQIFYPRPEFCTDNGAMIAFAGFLRAKQDAFLIENSKDNTGIQQVRQKATQKNTQTQSGLEIIVRPRWPMDTL